MNEENNSTALDQAENPKTYKASVTKEPNLPDYLIHECDEEKRKVSKGGKVKSWTRFKPPIDNPTLITYTVFSLLVILVLVGLGLVIFRGDYRLIGGSTVLTYPVKKILEHYFPKSLMVTPPNRLKPNGTTKKAIGRPKKE